MLWNLRIASAFGLCQMSWGGLWASISNDWSCSATLHHSQLLPLTDVPHLLNEAYVLKSLNQDLTVLWLNVCFGCQNSDLKMDEVDRIPLREAPRERILRARVMKRQLRGVQLTVRVSWACNPQLLNQSITISTSVHRNSQELHACNHHSSACCDITSHYIFIRLLHIAFNLKVYFKSTLSLWDS